jgi:glycerol kinase
MHTGTIAPQPRQALLGTIAWRLAGRLEYALEGSVFAGGATVQWLRDGLGLIARAAEVEALAASVPDSDGVVLVPAFAGLGAPHWDAHARGLLIGLTRGTTRAHVARAALDGIAWQVADVLAAMAGEAGIELRELRVDGGASLNDLLMQIQADYLGVPLVRPRQPECTALGAALLAGLGAGIYADPAQAGAAWRAQARFVPALAPAEVARRHRHWQRAVERSRDWSA